MSHVKKPRASARANGEKLTFENISKLIRDGVLAHDAEIKTAQAHLNARSLERIAIALERIADAQEALARGREDASPSRQRQRGRSRAS